MIVNSIINRVLIINLLIIIYPKIVNGQQTSNYITPKYTKVYGNQIENLTTVSNNGKELMFSQIQNNFNANHDGFMVYYEPNKKSSTSTHALLMSLYNGSNKLLDIFYENHVTLKLRRYHNINTSTYVDYRLFDKLFSKNNDYPVYKIYFSSNFIWVEDSKHGHSTPTAHSPLFWGLDISGNANLQLFTKKSSNAKIRLYEVYTKASYTNEDIMIYGFNTIDLIAHINKKISSPQQAARNTKNKEHQIADFVDKDALLLDQQALVENEETLNKVITIYPNPTSSLVNVVFRKTNLDTTNFKFNLSDLSGRVILTDEIQVKSGMHQTQIKLPNSLQKGVYFLKFSLGIEKGSKKLVIN